MVAERTRVDTPLLPPPSRDIPKATLAQPPVLFLRPHLPNLRPCALGLHPLLEETPCSLITNPLKGAGAMAPYGGGEGARSAQQPPRLLRQRPVVTKLFTLSKHSHSLHRSPSLALLESRRSQGELGRARSSHQHLPASTVRLS